MSQPTFSGTGSAFAVVPWHRIAVAATVVILTLLPLGYAYRIERGSLFVGGFGPNAIFYLLALLPGVGSIMHHVLQTRSRRMRGAQLVAAFNAFRDSRPEKRPARVAEAASQGTGDVPTLTSGVTAAIFLTAVFIFIAALADVHAKVRYTEKDITPIAGIIFCGLGAYVSVIYYMSARMYANAVSSRFLTTSALRSASTAAFGWVAVSIGLTNVLPSGPTMVGALFLSGLFFSWAIGALRSKAMTWFGAPKTDNEELPLGIVEGIDDTTADLLNEYGVTTVQHLATSDPADLCDQTLLPLDRAIDWVNQAILIQAVKRNIVAMRSLDVRTATKLVRVYVRAQAGEKDPEKVLNSLAEKTGLGIESLRALASCLLCDFNVRLLYEYSEGRPIDADRSDLSSYIDTAIQRYEIAGNRLQIRATPAAPSDAPPAQPPAP